MTILTQLNLLESSGLIRLARALPELEYLFRHSLVQDAAYESLLRQDRRRLHHSVGLTLEHTYADRLDELAPLLAGHFREGGDDERALQYFTLAANRAASQYANDEAAIHYRSAIAIVLEGNADDEMLIDLYVRYGRVLELSGRYDEALASYTQLSRWGEERGNRAMQLAGLLHSATIFSIPSARFDAIRGEALSRQALTLARESGDRKSEARILWNLLHVYTFTGRYQEALDYGNQSLAIARQLDLHEQMAYTLHDMQQSLVATDRHADAESSLEAAREFWRELHNLPMLADSYISAAEQSYLLGRLDKAQQLAQEGLSIAQSIGNEWGQSYAMMIMCFVYLERGQFSLAIHNMQECIRLGEHAGFSAPTIYVRALLAFLYITLGLPDRAVELVQQILTLASASFPGTLSWGLGLHAILYCAQDRLADAEAALADAIANDVVTKPISPTDMYFVPMAAVMIAMATHDYPRALQSVTQAIEHTGKAPRYVFFADALELKARILLRLNRASDAREALMEARAIAEHWNSIRVLWQIYATMSETERQLGNITESESLRREARRQVQQIAEQITEPEMREAFVATAGVKSLLDTAGQVLP